MMLLRVTLVQMKLHFCLLSTLLKYFSTKDYTNMWNYLNSLNLNLPKGEKTEIVPSFEGVTIRVYKPRKNNI